MDHDMDHDTFRREAHRVVDWMADYLATVAGRRVVPRTTPGAIRATLPVAPPEAGTGFPDILADFERLILPGMAHWGHPGWFAYFPANASPPSVLAEMVTAALAAQCMSWQTSPAATELEEVMLAWLAQGIGLPPGFTGVIQDTASSATFVALLTARDRARDAGVPLDRQTVYASTEAHASVEKGARLAGIPEANFRRIPVDAAYALDPAALDAAVGADRAAGLVPTAIVATVGTTSSTAVDPLPAIGRIARATGAWLHVDAAYAGSAAIAPEFRHHFAGLDAADSFVFNPHKWLGVQFDCSAYYVGNVEALLRTCATTPAYLRTAADPSVVNYRDWGIPLGRRFRALKIWFVLRSYGLEGLRARIREHVRLARAFALWVDGEPRLVRMAPVPFALVVFRVTGGSPQADDAATRALLDRVNDSGEVYLTHTVLDGRVAIRCSVGSWTTDAAAVRRVWQRIQEALASTTSSPPAR